MITDREEMIAEPIEIAGNTYDYMPIYGQSPWSSLCRGYRYHTYGNSEPLFENHKIFPDRVNTEFVQVVDRRIKMRVWERGLVKH